MEKELQDLSNKENQLSGAVNEAKSTANKVVMAKLDDVSRQKL